MREPTEPSDRDGVRVHPLAARNPLWITESAKYPSPVRLANKAATVLNHRVASEFAALLDDVAPDVLHTHSMVELPPAVWDRAAQRGVPIVHTLHDYDLLCIRGALFKDGRKCHPRHLACRMLSAPKRALHDRIDAVAAVSRTVLDTHLDHGLFAHLPPERQQIVWNPAKLAQPSQPRRPRAQGEPVRFGFLGRVTAEKGLGPLLTACRALPPSGWTLRIAGEGSERPGFEAQARDLPVQFDGYVEAASFLAEVDVLICAPLWDEPFGLTTIEAYAAGCRVIGSSAGVIGEVIERVDPGWSVPSGDAPALAAAMQQAIAQASALPMGSQPAVKSLLAQLAPTCVAQTYLNLYSTVQPRTIAPLAANG